MEKLFKMSKQRLVILLLSLIGMIGVGLNWYSIMFLNLTGFDIPLLEGLRISVGYIVIALYMIPCIFTLIGDKLKSMKIWMSVISIFFALLSSMIGILGYIKVYESWIDGTVNYGIGLHLVTLAGILITIFTFILFKRK